MRASRPRTMRPSKQTRHSPLARIALRKHALHERRRGWVQHRLRANSMACSLLHELYATMNPMRTCCTRPRIRPSIKGASHTTAIPDAPSDFAVACCNRDTREHRGSTRGPRLSTLSAFIPKWSAAHDKRTTPIALFRLGRHQGIQRPRNPNSCCLPRSCAGISVGSVANHMGSAS